MRKERILTSYIHMTDFELSTLGGRILKAMQDPINVTNFPEPTPDLESLGRSVNDFINKHEIASRRGSGVQIGEKNESRVLLLNDLRTLGQYINRTADGQISLLLATGFNLAARPSANLAPLTTERVNLRDGRYSGQLRVDFTPVRTAWEYEIQIGEINTAGAIEWMETMLTTSSRGNVLMDRVPGIRYAVRVRARNGKGYGDWSEPVSIMAR